MPDSTEPEALGSLEDLDQHENGRELGYRRHIHIIRKWNSILSPSQIIPIVLQPCQPDRQFPGQQEGLSWWCRFSMGRFIHIGALQLSPNGSCRGYQAWSGKRFDLNFSVKPVEIDSVAEFRAGIQHGG